MTFLSSLNTKAQLSDSRVLSDVQSFIVNPPQMTPTSVFMMVSVGPILSHNSWNLCFVQPSLDPLYMRRAATTWQGILERTHYSSPGFVTNWEVWWRGKTWPNIFPVIVEIRLIWPWSGKNPTFNYLSILYFRLSHLSIDSYFSSISISSILRSIYLKSSSIYWNFSSIYSNLS